MSRFGKVTCLGVAMHEPFMHGPENTMRKSALLDNKGAREVRKSHTGAGDASQKCPFYISPFSDLFAHRPPMFQVMFLSMDMHEEASCMTPHIYH